MFQCIDVGYKPELLLSIDRPTALVPHVLVVCSEPQLFHIFISKQHLGGVSTEDGSLNFAS